MTKKRGLQGASKPDAPFYRWETEAQDQREIPLPLASLFSGTPAPTSLPYLKQSACQSAFRAWRYWPS